MLVPVLVSSAEGRGWFVVAEPVGTVKKPKRSVRGFFKRLVEIINKKSPKATLIDFHSCGSFDRLSFFFGPFFFLCENRSKKFPARIAYRPRSTITLARSMADFYTLVCRATLASPRGCDPPIGWQTGSRPPSSAEYRCAATASPHF